jgi:hypothetical protein
MIQSRLWDGIGKFYTLMIELNAPSIEDPDNVASAKLDERTFARIMLDLIGMMRNNPAFDNAEVWREMVFMHMRPVSAKKHLVIATQESDFLIRVEDSATGHLLKSSELVDKDKIIPFLIASMRSLIEN